MISSPPQTSSLSVTGEVWLNFLSRAFQLLEDSLSVLGPGSRLFRFFLRVMGLVDQVPDEPQASSVLSFFFCRLNFVLALSICMPRKPLAHGSPVLQTLWCNWEGHSEVIFLLALAHDNSKGLPLVALKQCPGSHQPTTGLDNAENSAWSEEFLNYLGNGNGWYNYSCCLVSELFILFSVVVLW